MNSKIAIVTGANGGMGRVITETLAQSGLEVVMACRDLDKSIPVWQKISEKTQANIHLIRLDLSSLESVLQFIHEIRTRFTHVDLLINNAGVMPSKALKSDFGMEYTIGVNYFSPYLITTALTKMMPIGARVVNVSSLMYRYGKITPSVFDSLKGKHYSRFNAYANSKLALLYMGIDLSDTIQKKGITINVCEPGIVNTPILKMGNRLVDFLANLLFRPFIRSPKKGAETIIYLALDESVAEKSGGFYSNKKVVKLPQKYFEGEERYLLRKLTQQYIETNQITL